MSKFKFNRLELAGSLGDLGTLLPIAMAMILINGLKATGIFFSVGLFYILSGLYFGLTVPIQPMKVIGAYAIATALSPEQILASTLLMAIFLLLIGITRAINLIHKITPKAVIRGVQLSTGTLLMSGGLKLILGTSKYQLLQKAVEPQLVIQYIGQIPISLILGTIAAFFTLFLLNNKKFPAALVIVLGGIILGLLLGKEANFLNHIGFYLPAWLNFNFPQQADFTFALFALVLPQIPMTMGNAVLAYTDLSQKYFGEQAKKLSNPKVCISMGLANLLAFVVGGMPLCHGAGGLAAHYRFGARTAGSNLIIGSIFLALALLFGEHLTAILKLIPLSILGVLLLFAGSNLALTIMDLKTKKDYFIALLILSLTLTLNLAVGFIMGIIVAQILKWEKLDI